MSLDSERNKVSRRRGTKITRNNIGGEDSLNNPHSSIRDSQSKINALNNNQNLPTSSLNH
jgi:hypothetical protein